MTQETYYCNICEQQLEVLGRNRIHCHTLCPVGPIGMMFAKMIDEEYRAHMSGVHICPHCWTGLRGVFADEKKNP